MFELIEAVDIKRDDVLIDLRSEGEHSEFHIPGSISFPILNDGERKVVGTLYANNQIRQAKIEAIRFATPKLIELETVLYENKDKRVILYCQRGGYRSKSVASFFYSLGYNVFKLMGGIKAYRNMVNKELPELIQRIHLLVLYGATGSGKTDILEGLEAEGVPVLNLEEMCNHMGSVLGSVGRGKPNSQKMFEALLYDKLKTSEERCFITEGESKRIGDVIQPDLLYEKLKIGKKIYIKTDLDTRVERLVDIYAKKENREELILALDKLSKYVSKKMYDDILNKLDQDNYRGIAEILCINYYDKNYKVKETDTDYIIDYSDITDARYKIKQVYNEIK